MMYVETVQLFFRIDHSEGCLRLEIVSNHSPPVCELTDTESQQAIGPHYGVGSDSLQTEQLLF